MWDWQSERRHNNHQINIHRNDTLQSYIEEKNTQKNDTQQKENQPEMTINELHNCPMLSVIRESAVLLNVVAPRKKKMTKCG
jgi:hypothetical protein